MIKRKKCRMCEISFKSWNSFSGKQLNKKRRPKKKRIITTSKNTSVYKMWFNSNAQNS